MISGIIPHLWQSTLFAGVAFFLTLVLRKNRAHVRYWVWFAASVKFLIPFSLLVALGSQVPWASEARTEWIAVVDQIGQPLMAPSVVTQAVIANRETGTNYLPVAIFALWACGFAAITLNWLLHWWRMRSVRRSASFPRTLSVGRIAIPVLSSETLHEPGVFGIFRPVLLLPAGIADRIERAQLDAILRHELSHVRRKDNLTAAIHMVVEALFWFHPLVWWLGARLIDERERACDEEVLEAGGDPGVYAEGILNVCKLYVKSPITCMTGVSGANLRKRIEEIMANRILLRLSRSKKVALAAAGAAVVALPIAIGMINALPVRAQDALPQFEVATLKLNPSVGLRMMAGGPSLQGSDFGATNIPLNVLLAYAFQMRTYQISGPNWINDTRYDIRAKVPPDAPAGQHRAMLRALLEERLNISTHRSMQEMNVYNMVVSRGGPKFRPMEPGEQDKFAFPYSDAAYLLLAGDMARWGEVLSPAAGRPVLDKTGLPPGNYRVMLAYYTGQGNSDTPGLFTAIPEQLGLRLEAAKDLVEIVVVDRAEKTPVEN